MLDSYISEEILASTLDKECAEQYLAIIYKAYAANRKRYAKSDARYVYYEQHHILPKSLYPAYQKDKTNLVLLLAEEHFKVHQLLTKVWPGREMAYAFWRMCYCNGTKLNITAEDYSYGRQLMQQYPVFKGRHFTDESKSLLRQRSREFWQRGGYEHTEEQDLKMVATRKTNGSYVRTDEQNKKVSATMKGLIFINNGKQNKRVYESDILPYLDQGWVRGKLPLTDEHKKHIGEAGKGRPGWNKGLSGTFTGRKHTEEAKQKMRESKQRKKAII